MRDINIDAACCRSFRICWLRGRVIPVHLVVAIGGVQHVIARTADKQVVSAVGRPCTVASEKDVIARTAVEYVTVSECAACAAYEGVISTPTQKRVVSSSTQKRIVTIGHSLRWFDVTHGTRYRVNSVLRPEVLREAGEELAVSVITGCPWRIVALEEIIFERSDNSKTLREDGSHLDFLRGSVNGVIIRRELLNRSAMGIFLKLNVAAIVSCWEFGEIHPQRSADIALVTTPK
ncbi:hypothetical protein XH87_07705 [Bradyrhizobium sp. CCBAU 53415]|nr:hypothetical protein [Bradyrhizobium sp. CCBAU 53415]